MRPIRPDRNSVWAAWRYDAFEGRVRRVNFGYVVGHWRVVITQRWRRWEMWYPGDADGLARARRQLRNADALR